MAKYDFSGWATRANMRCSDGRIIADDAFKDDDGRVVPLIWNHRHTDPSEVLGHALLENRGDGVYAYCSFNDTKGGRLGKELVRHGDIASLSICANQLQQIGSLVKHGKIREVSLVLAGANPGASIEDVAIHSDDVEDDSVAIYTGEPIELYHGEEMEDGTEIVSEQKEEKEEPTVLEHADETKETTTKSTDDVKGGKTVQDVIDSMNDEQQKVLYALVGAAVSDTTDDDDEDDSTGGNDEMKQNVFDTTDEREMDGVLMHSDGTLVTVDEIETVFKDAKRYGSLKDSCLNHGIEDVDWLFPDDRNLNTPPAFIKRDTGWVSKVMNSVHHTPFSRIKSMFADITEDDARAKGYIKGKMKKEEFFSLLKRSTSPTTVYKKQKMDRDDVIDITGFDVVSWLKSEMRMKLDEELARAYLIGDGRLASSDDKINEQCIRPVAKDDDLFTVHSVITVASAATDDDKAKAFIKQVIKERKNYKGSGNPSLYTTEDMLTNMLLLTDEIGRDLYPDETSLARKLRVKEIVTVPPMESAKDAENNPLVGIVVNMADYNVGADKGGAVNMFDDFDIDYNQQKYLIETRCSGALTVPYSAMAFSMKTQG